MEAGITLCAGRPQQGSTITTEKSIEIQRVIPDDFKSLWKVFGQLVTHT